MSAMLFVAVYLLGMCGEAPASRQKCVLSSETGHGKLPRHQNDFANSVQAEATLATSLGERTVNLAASNISQASITLHTKSSAPPPESFSISLMLSQAMMTNMLTLELGTFLRRWNINPKSIMQNKTRGWIVANQDYSDSFTPGVTQMKAVPTGDPAGRSEVTIQVNDVSFTWNAAGTEGLVGLEHGDLSMTLDLWATEDLFLGEADDYPHVEMKDFSVSADKKTEEPKKVDLFRNLKYAWSLLSAPAWYVTSKFSELMAVMAGKASFRSHGCLKAPSGAYYDFRIVKLAADEDGNFGVGVAFVRRDVAAGRSNAFDDVHVPVPLDMLTNGNKRSKFGFYFSPGALLQFTSEPEDTQGEIISMMTSTIKTSLMHFALDHVTNPAARIAAKTSLARMAAAKAVNLLLWWFGVASDPQLEQLENVISGSLGEGLAMVTDISQEQGVLAALLNRGSAPQNSTKPAAAQELQEKKVSMSYCPST